MKVSNAVLARIKYYIQLNDNHSKTANHFYRLYKRIVAGKKLTHKMKSNLAAIESELADEVKKIQNFEAKLARKK